VGIRLIAKSEAAFRLVEAAHDGRGAWVTWAERIHEAARSLLASGVLSLGVGRRREHGYEVLAAAADDPAVVEYFLSQKDQLAPESLDPYWRFPYLVGTTSGILGAEQKPLLLRNFEANVGAADILGLVALADEFSLSVGVAHPVHVQIGARERQVLTQVTLHLEAGLRVRCRPNDVVAVLDVDGRLLHAKGKLREPESREHLARHVHGVEKGRSRRLGRDDDALDAWSALVAGEWGLVEREEPGIGRHYAVLETPRAHRLRSLTTLETSATELGARGLTGKMVAYALGVGEPTVSKLLGSAALKLGIGSRTRLVKLVARLLAIGPTSVDPPGLTAAEHDVLALVRLGWTNKAIAEARGRSERTVANQVASLLRKMQMPSRRALAVAAQNA
jgi:DNA-binding NarL/FixJ family response regulator